jgi:hypothetical protein
MRPARYFAILAAAAGATFLALWAWIAAMPLAYLDPEYPYWAAKQSMLRRCDLGQLVILGDSRAAVGILPARLPLTATNLAVGGGKPTEALAALRRVLACPDPPRHVLISLDPGHFMKPDLFWERSVRFGFLDGADLAELAALSRATGDWSVHEARQSDGLTPPIRSALYRLRLPPYYFNSVLKSGGFLRWWSNRAALRDGLATRGQYYFGTADGSDGVALDASLDRFAPTPVLDATFQRLLALLGEHGIRAYFVPMPVNESTWRAIRPGVMAAFHAYLDEQARRHPGFRVLSPTAPHWPDRWFGDAFAHLNPAGAERFSRRLAACLPLWMRGAEACEPATEPLSAAAGSPTQHTE